MGDSIDRVLATVAARHFHFGQVLVRPSAAGFALRHRDESDESRLEVFRNSDDAVAIARYDDHGRYRPLKTAPNLRHGWRMALTSLADVRRALDFFYPGRLATFTAWREKRLQSTPLRDTLDRQSGMYRVAAKISDDQADFAVADFCRSDGGCLRTILWKRDHSGSVPSTRLPGHKFDPNFDQVPGFESDQHIPLICQEACTLLISKCRAVVKGEPGED